MSNSRSSTRLSKILSQVTTPLTPTNTSGTYNTMKSDSDVVIVSCCRTPIGKAKRGVFKDTHVTDLLAPVLREVVDRVQLDPKEVEDVYVGNCLLPGGGASQFRMALFLAGFPEDVSVAATNRQCSSGLQATANIAAAIQSGFIKIGISAGVESMSTGQLASSVGELNDKVFENQQAQDCLLPMGITSENVSERYGVTRLDQDKFAAESYRRAEVAQDNHLFDEEIVPVDTTIVNKEGVTENIHVVMDEGVRRGTTFEKLQKLRPSFKEDGCSTAGNSSQVSDGASAVLMMRRDEAVKRGLPILGRFVSFAVAGVPPSVMGIGPAFAVPKALDNAGLAIEDIDIFELNEAFASQALYCMRKLGIPHEKVNPLGGAIAFGHPLGCTGNRQISTLLYQLRRTGKRFGVVTMCIGTGMGAAGIFEAEY